MREEHSTLRQRDMGGEGRAGAEDGEDGDADGEMDVWDEAE